MSIIRSAAELIVRAHDHYKFHGRVLSLGVAEVSATPEQLGDWFPRYTGAPSQLVPEEAEISTNAMGARLRWVTAKSFFKAFGINTVHSLDIPGCEHPAELIHDLNTPLPPEHHGKYDFVFDPGTLEHIFDQRQCFETIRSVLAVGGIICHFVPIYSYNGGYYSINPNVVHDFYRQNGFGDITSYVIMWDRFRMGQNVRTRCYTYREDVLGSRHAVADPDQVRYTPHLLFFARKLRDVDQVVCPIQFEGDYVGNASALSEARSQSLESRGKKWAALARKFIPESWAYYLQSVVYRALVLRRARREVGFWI